MTVVYNERLRRARVEEGQVAVLRALGKFMVAACNVDTRNLVQPSELGRNLSERMEGAMDGTE